MIPDKTIGDIAKTDIEVLRAYSGDSRATYTSGCGLIYLSVADCISEDIESFWYDLKYKFILENADALMEEYDIERDPKWTDDEIYQNIDEALYDDYGMTDEWMQKELPEYEVEDDRDYDRLLLPSFGDDDDDDDDDETAGYYNPATGYLFGGWGW